jgi:type VI secretion system secreted protein Hcp
MNRNLLRALPGTIVAAALTLATPVHALEAFLQVPGIDGESVDAGHPRWITIQAFGLSATTRLCKGITVLKGLDVASPLLGAAVVNGDVFAQVQLDLAKPGGKGSGAPFWSLTLKDVMLTSVTQNLDTALNTLTEQLTLQPTSIDMSYRPQKPDGSFDSPVVSSFDCPAAAALPPAPHEDDHKGERRKSG